MMRLGLTGGGATALVVVATLAMAASGDQSTAVSQARAPTQLVPVRARIEGGNVGYIRLNQFDEQATSGLKTAIDTISSQVPANELAGYVLDLRNNPGGLVEQAISVSRAFLRNGEIVSIRGRNPDDTQRFGADAGDLAEGKPVIVLINGGTAGASEIVAGALQDQGRATVVGTRSSGMGSVQTILPLGAGNGSLRLTTGRAFTPSGRPIEGNGITPNAEVREDQALPSDPQDDKPLRAALGILRGAPANSSSAPHQ
jgi:carboxyl-terminal processing protease